MSGLTAPHLTFHQSRTRILCTNFVSLSDSLTLDWYPNFNAAPGQARKLLRIRKDWTTNPPDRPDNQRANSMLLNDDCTYRGGGELVFGSENKLYHANKPRDRKEATNYKESFIQQSATHTRCVERCGRIRQQLIQQTDVLRQQEGTNMRGSQTRNKQKK
jgi:hypothetical protein